MQFVLVLCRLWILQGNGATCGIVNGKKCTLIINWLKRSLKKPLVVREDKISTQIRMACKSMLPVCMLMRGRLQRGLAAVSSHVTARHCSTQPDTTLRPYIPRRDLTYVPGNDERKLLKVPSLNADCVVLDCEDGVAINRKVIVCDNRCAYYSRTIHTFPNSNWGTRVLITDAAVTAHSSLSLNTHVA